MRRALLASSALAAVGIATAATAQDEPAGDESAGPVERIVVTAARREQLLSEVPVSVAAYTPERIDQQGIRSIDDIARLTPGVTFARGDGRNAGASNIAIRGISSTVAASTTGIYIDDTPIQTRIIGAGASNFNTYPSVFDLQRVEVLRGPQGTLFGAGSEGGTIRFITTQPDLDDYSMYGRAETGLIENGGMNYETGLAVGGPIIEDKLGFRVSAWTRRDGGFVDRVNTDPLPGEAPLAIRDADPSTPPTIIPTRRNVNFVVEENANFQDHRVINGALTFLPAENLEVTGSVFYQRSLFNDSNVYWEHLSNPDSGEYRKGTAIGQPSEDEFWLPAVAVKWDLGAARLVSNTSYFNRDQSAINDYTAFESSLWAGYWEFPVGMFAPTTQINTHKGWTQELRLESTGSSWIDWVAGVFYQTNDQVSQQFVEDLFLPNLFFDARGVPFQAVFGQGLSQGRYTFNQDPVSATDEQLAAFAQADIHLTDRLTAIVGVRYGETSFEAEAHYEGPVVGPPVNDSGEKTEWPLTPKVGLSFQMTDDNLLYATAAKGFRVGGYNPQIGLPCIPQLLTLGYTPSPGNPTGRPTTFESDSLWSYEVGTKNEVLGGRGQLNGSAYYIEWDNIQQNVGIGSCGFGFTINAGSAVSQGFDLEGSLAVTDRLTLSTALGYNDAEFQETIFGGPGAVVSQVSEGDHLAGAPWTFTASGQYDFFLLDTNAFLRFDYEYRSEGPDDTPGLNPANRSPVLPPLDPLVAIPTPETQNLSMRLGADLGESANISFFIRNLTNENPNLGRADLAFSPAPSGLDTHNYTGQTLIPRTFGVTLTYRR
jgi:outer membrane receptor protein involved in Fe transport